MSCIHSVVQLVCHTLIKTKKCVFKIVPNRKAQTLLAIIYDHVLPGSIIHSDSWSAYNDISSLNKNYIHKKCNHSLAFIIPGGVHTNTVESYWNAAKAKLKEMRGVKRIYLQSYIDEFIWRKNNALRREEAFEAILRAIALNKK